MTRGGAVLAIDPGTRRLGIAVSDGSARVALPLEVLPRDARFLDRLAEIASEREVGEVVVGLPLRLDGSEGPAAAEARKLAAEIENKLGIEVRMVDERMTTRAADRALAEGIGGRARRQKVDKAAAALLLQTYLDLRKRERE